MLQLTLMLFFRGVSIEKTEVPEGDLLEAVILETAHYVFVFKATLDEPAEIALSKIKEKKYDEKYLNKGKAVLLVGIKFSSLKSNVENWIVEEEE
jgi:hypothetical protein